MRRRAGESFIIGEEIEVEILEIAGTRVKLGIVAPASVGVVRKEVWLTRSANLIAAQGVEQGLIQSLLSKLPR
jgi:carbon storage regulator